MYSGDGMNESDDSSFWIPTILNVMDSDGCTAETGLIRYPPTAGVYIVQFEIISFWFYSPERWVLSCLLCNFLPFPFSLLGLLYHHHSTICPRSSDPFYVVCYYIKWVTTSWTHSICIINILDLTASALQARDVFRGVASGALVCTVYITLICIYCTDVQTHALT